MTCASKTWVSCACAGSSGGSTGGCRASCAWLGWEAVKEHPLKGSADHLLPPSLLSPSSLLPGGIAVGAHE